MSSRGHPEWFIRDDPIFQNLLEIRDSLLHLLDRKVNGPRDASIASQLNGAIRIRVKHLRANALYSAGIDDVFEADLYKLDYRISRFGHFFNRGNQDLFAESRNVLEVHLYNLVEWIEDEVSWKGEEAMLNSFPLRPCLRKKENR